MTARTIRSGEPAGNTTIGDAGPLPGWLGSKAGSGATERILSWCPWHSIYVEAFLGNGSVLRRKTPALHSIGIDEDPEVIRAWRATNFPAEFVCGSSIAILDGASWLPADALVYADPPYPIETRTSKARYAREFTPQKHVELLEVLDALPCTVIVSSYWNDLYAKRLSGWEHDAFTATTRGGPRTEHLWIKRGSSPAGYAEAARYAGRNYRERERIKRKARRWQANFSKLPRAEKDAVLRAILEPQGYDVTTTKSSGEIPSTSMASVDRHEPGDPAIADVARSRSERPTPPPAPMPRSGGPREKSSPSPTNRG